MSCRTCSSGRKGVGPEWLIARAVQEWGHALRIGNRRLMVKFPRHFRSFTVQSMGPAGIWGAEYELPRAYRDEGLDFAAFDEVEAELDAQALCFSCLGKTRRSEQ